MKQNSTDIAIDQIMGEGHGSGELREEASQVQGAGRFGDTELVHLNPEERALLEAVYGPATTNPETGLPEHFWGGLIGAGAGLLGGLFGDDAEDEAAELNAERFKKAISIYENAFNILNIDYGEFADAQNIYQGMIPDQIMASADRARAGLQASAQASRQGVLDRGEQQYGAAQQSAIDRGLFNTTAYDADRRGVSADVDRRMLEIESTLGSQMAGIDMQEGSALTNSYGQLARMLYDKGNTRIGLSQDYADIFLNRQSQPNTALAGSLGQLGGTLFGGDILDLF